MTLIQKIRSSITTQLAIWVGGVIIVISGTVIFLLARFSEDVIREETIETTLQALKNSVQIINNKLKQADTTAKLEHSTFIFDKSLIEKLTERDHFLTTLNQSLPNAKLQVTDNLESVTESGYQQQTREDGTYYIFYTPVYDGKYKIAITCPTNDIYSNFIGTQIIMLLTAIVGILILLFICWRIMVWHLYPLHRLADAAQSIADGHLDETIPDSRQENEIGQLQNSLSKMERSLANYMREMQQKQENLNLQHAKLQEAYSKIQEYDQLKTMFLHQMTNQITCPVDTIYNHTHKICNDYYSLSNEEMEHIQENILAASESITQLLNQLLNTPAQKTYNIDKDPKTTAAP